LQDDLQKLIQEHANKTTATKVTFVRMVTEAQLTSVQQQKQQQQARTQQNQRKVDHKQRVQAHKVADRQLLRLRAHYEMILGKLRAEQGAETAALQKRLNGALRAAPEPTITPLQANGQWQRMLQAQMEQLGSALGHMLEHFHALLQQLKELLTNCPTDTVQQQASVQLQVVQHNKHVIFLQQQRQQLHIMQQLQQQQRQDLAVHNMQQERVEAGELQRAAQRRGATDSAAAIATEADEEEEEEEEEEADVAAAAVAEEADGSGSGSGSSEPLRIVSARERRTGSSEGDDRAPDHGMGSSGEAARQQGESSPQEEEEEARSNDPADLIRRGHLAQEKHARARADSMRDAQAPPPILEGHSAPPPAGWIMRESRSCRGSYFYVNTQDNSTRWTRPSSAELAETAAEAEEAAEASRALAAKKAKATMATDVSEAAIEAALRGFLSRYDPEYQCHAPSIVKALSVDELMAELQATYGIVDNVDSDEEVTRLFAIQRALALPSSDEEQEEEGARKEEEENKSEDATAMVDE
jgi:hypothetical protein